MDNLLRILPAFSLMIQFNLAMDLPVLSNYVIKQTASCPEVGYYFRREPAPNTVDPGPCYLCFCQRNSTAVCWLRENSRCDVEKFHHYRVGRNSRARRSPMGLSDIFFRDATRDFFDKQLPEQCKPYESSFSDGCPPADWCVGCTVCDCDANGRWDCHILSFCNGDERKKMKNRKVPLPKMPTRRVYHQGEPPVKNKVMLRSKKIVKKSIPKPRFRNTKSKNNNKKPNKNLRKSNNNGKKSNENARKSIHHKRNQQKERTRQKKPRKIITTRKPQQRRNVVKKPHKKATKTKSQKTTRSPQKNKMRKRPNTATEKQKKQDLKESEIKKIINAHEYDQSKLGRRIIRKVMSTVQRMIAKQVANLQNATRVQRSINSQLKKDCLKKKKEKKKGKKKAKLSYKELREQKLRKYKKQYNFRKKRYALDLMDLSVIELKAASNVEKLMQDDLKNVDLTVKRIIKNVTVLDAGDSNMTKTELQHNSTNKIILATMTTEINNITNKPLVLKSTISNTIYYKYSFDKNATNSSFTTECVPLKNETDKTTLVLDLTVTEKAKNIAESHTEKAKKYAIITSNPELNDLKYQKWERLKILRDKNNNIQIKEVLKFDTPNKKVNGTKLDDSLIKRFKYKIHRKDVKRKLDVTNKYNLKKIISSNFKTANIKSQFTANGTMMNYNISSLQNLLQNLMRELKTPIKQSKQKTKFGMFKYMRDMFKKLFSRRKGVHLEHKTNEGHTLEILCENIGACFLNQNNKIALRAKIHDLNKETEKIFRTIKMIKGLLYLIEMPLKKVDNQTKKTLHDDIRKLDAILKGTYATGENSYLSQTQEAQIGYVKENIHLFIKSVGRFATILNEILEVLYKDNKKYSCQRNLRLRQKKKKLSSLNQIKNLLIKYNVVQNTFMKKIYQLLTDVEKNMTTENPKLQVSDIEMNNPHIVDRYSKNIIENLRRLKNLALALNYSRKKRQTMREDDAIEYLLVLMEYLLKQNHPLDTAPVNDGIDLLIEAIQNAPDIKPMEKKIIDSFSTTPTPTRTTSIDVSYLKEDSISDSNRISKEEFKENNLFKNENELAIEQVVDDGIETTQIVYYKKFDDSDNMTVYSEYDTTTKFAGKTKNENTEKGETGEKTGFDRLESAIDETRKYEVYTSDLDDDAIIPVVTMSTTEKELPSTVTTKVEESTIVPLRDYKLDDDPVDDKKTKLEWIEENFGKEIREYSVYNVFNISDTTAISLTSQIATTIKPLDQNIDNISSLTVELEDENKKKKAKAVADEVLYRKQIEFLNSLDYGTERSEFDDPESKDDEKFSGDGFSSYFVK